MIVQSWRTRYRRGLIYGGVVICLVGFLSQAVLSMWDDSPTFDEVVAPAIGYAELFTGDYRLVNDHPPLYRVFVALPLLALRPVLPVHHPSWRKVKVDPRDRYDFAREFFYGSNDNADRLFFWSRVPVVFLSLLLGLLVFQWARELFGPLAGLFALFLYSFEPNIIAHSRLATNDLILTLLIFSTMYQFWRYTRSPSLKSLVLAGVLFGLALLSKFSAIILFPLLVLTALLVSYGTPGTQPEADSIWRRNKLLASVLASIKPMLVISVVALLVVLLFYRGQWNLFVQGIHNAVSHYERGHDAFFMGSYSGEGWWYYFPVAFLIKTPISFLVLVTMAILFLSFRKDKAQYFLLVPACILVAVAVLGNLNIGIRHILPIYPFLIVLASSVVTISFSRPRFFFPCLGGLALWHLWSALSIFPSYIAYFNEFVGPERGYEILADSNVDWGQDLKRLKKFMDEKGIRQVYLSYFGTGDPCYYGIRHSAVAPYPDFRSSCALGPWAPPSDLLAVSVTNLQGVYLTNRGAFEWLKPYQPAARIGHSIFVYDIRGNVAARNNLGVIYLNQGMLREALSEFKLAAELTPKESMVHSNLGFTYTLLSMPSQAEIAYRQALALDPKNQVAREGLKKLSTFKGR